MTKVKRCYTLSDMDRAPRKSQKKARFTLRLTTEEHADLMGVAKRADVPASQLVRLLIRKHLPGWKTSLGQDRTALVLVNIKERTL